MYSKSIVAASLLVAGAAATNHAAGEQMVHVVQVGGPNAEFIFYPQNTIAKVGDIIQFQFNPKNHSVVQSTFDKPCIPIQESMPEKLDSFYSGFMPTELVPAGQKPVYSVKVTSEDPMWFYCSQGKHCNAGMVGAINAKAEGEKTIQAHTELAKAAPEIKNPGQKPAGEAPYPYPGTGVPTGYWTPSGTGAPEIPSSTFFPGSPSPTGGATPEEADPANAASTLKSGLLAFAGTVAAAFLAL